MEIHIATLGLNEKIILSAVKKYSIDKLYLITSKDCKEQLNKIKSIFNEIGIEIEVYYIDPFKSESYSKILDYFISIRKEHEKDNIHVNITGGTNFMTAAALSGSQFIQAKPYYITMDKKTEKQNFLEVPIVNISFKDTLTDKQKKIFILIYQSLIKTKEIKNINTFAESIGLSKQNFKQFSDNFVKLNLIEIEKDGKENVIKPTNTGTLIMSLIQN